MTAADLIAGARALIKPLVGHTPGPWQQGETIPSMIFAWWEPPNSADSVICEAQDKNAALLAAAPVMRDTIAALLDDRDALTQRIEALEAENVKLQALVRPQWFYSADTYDSDSCRYSVGDVLEEDYFWDRPQTGQHVVEISAGTPLPSIWAAVRFACECDDPDECECDNEMIVTEHVSEAEARAALQADEVAP